MLEEVAPDVVFISTNWTNHAPWQLRVWKKERMLLYEVPLATSMEDLWAIINTRKGHRSIV